MTSSIISSSSSVCALSKPTSSSSKHWSPCSCYAPAVLLLCSCRTKQPYFVHTENDMLGCKAALTLCILHVMVTCSVSQQLSTPEPLQQSSNTPGSDGDSQPSSTVPAAAAGVCWAPGSTPQYSVNLLGALDANLAADSYASNPDLLFTGYW